MTQQARQEPSTRGSQLSVKDVGRTDSVVKICGRCRAAFEDAAVQCSACGASGSTRPDGAPAKTSPVGLINHELDLGCLLPLILVGLCSAVGWLVTGSTGALVGAIIGMVLASAAMEAA